jgi:CheY-like chemotaxis protein
MIAPKPKLLIVDDENSMRASLSAILSRAGYEVRSAQDGFSALAEIRRECPDLLLSDLNMPGMSGFELLSVIRRRCPGIRVVAMSGAFSGDRVPTGIAADGYYAKGTNLSTLLETLGRLAAMGRPTPGERVGDPAPLWIALKSERFEEVSSITISCPDCLRTFTLPLDVSVKSIRKAQCVHCSAPVSYSIVESLLPSVRAAGRYRTGAATL